MRLAVQTLRTNWINLSTCSASNKDVFVQLFVVHFSFSRWNTLTSLEAFSHLVPSPHSLAQGCHLFLQKCSSIWWKVEVCVLVPLETLWKISSGIDFWEEHSTETASGIWPPTLGCVSPALFLVAAQCRYLYGLPRFINIRLDISL